MSTPIRDANAFSVNRVVIAASPVAHLPHIWQLDGVVSRKKQLLPYLIECLGRMVP